MKTVIKVEKEVEIKYLFVEAGVRYWEDAEVNGEEDTEGNLIPCRSGDYWKPIIDVDKGQIVNWGEGITAKIHYKVCDDGNYSLKNEEGEEIIKIDGYVPDTISPEVRGYGDYIIMNVDAQGNIANWNFNINDFIDEEED